MYMWSLSPQLSTEGRRGCGGVWLILLKSIAISFIYPTVVWIVCIILVHEFFHLPPVPRLIVLDQLEMLTLRCLPEDCSAHLVKLVKNTKVKHF